MAGFEVIIYGRFWVIAEVREGRISVTRHMEDWVGLFRQIGALPSAL
jgi:hypothetical protein